MKRIQLKDLELLDFGNTLQMTSVIYSNRDNNYICVLPNESIEDVDSKEYSLLELSDQEWETVLRQTDFLDVKVNKAIVRKSQRQIDQNMAWASYRRDNFRCRYCGRNDVPLTVDHVILWEDGGASVTENMLTSCKPCNRDRGNMKYEDWINSESYKRRKHHLTELERARNIELIDKLEHLKSLAYTTKRSR